MPSNIGTRQYQVYCPCAGWGSPTSGAKAEGTVSCFKCCCENTYLNSSTACEELEAAAAAVCKSSCETSPADCETCRSTLLKDWYLANIPETMRNCVECCHDWRKRNIHS